MKSCAGTTWKIFLLIFGLGCIVAGILLVASDVSRFIATEAEVVSVTEYYEGEDSTLSYDVDYTYQANGSTYTGSLTSRTQRSVGDRITVYYNPNAPSESWTSRGQKRLTGAILLVIGLWPVVGLGQKWWKGRKAKPQETAGTAGAG